VQVRPKDPLKGVLIPDQVQQRLLTCRFTDFGEDGPAIGDEPVGTQRMIRLKKIFGARRSLADALQAYPTLYKSSHETNFHQV